MNRRNRIVHALACVFACLAGPMSAGPAVAYFDHYLQGTVVGTLTQDQLAVLTDVFRKTLEQGADGVRVPFTLPPDARQRRVEGSFTPLRSRQDRGDRCRQLRSEFRRAGETEAWTGWYCKEKDGNWKSRKLPK
ncbi:hypothetical protein [Cupriavidus lacunae]|uniref:Surface antigen domain-containing protein n=1 Tax=Cupriavidus lacunae TaxID=2666307 RepID=A0A370NQ30_9BURK|nr:hypothetical protein [Cupriavidus lacunae]RDK07681.1 hypothetical protein DN412_24955 [Cupriavidus lacunae]